MEKESPPQRLLPWWWRGRWGGTQVKQRLTGAFHSIITAFTVVVGWVQVGSPVTGTAEGAATHRAGTPQTSSNRARWRTWWLVSHGIRTYCVLLLKTVASGNGPETLRMAVRPAADPSDPPNRISQREDSRIAPPRSSGSNGSGGAINTFGRARNSTLNRVNILASPINRHQKSLNGLSRNRFRRSDRSRTHGRERSGGVGGCLDYSDKTNRYGADRRSRIHLRIPLRALSLRNLVLGYECGRFFPAGVGPGSPLRDAANWLPSHFSRSVETRQRYGWLRMVFPGSRLFRAPIWCPSGGRLHARGKEPCRGEPDSALSGGCAPDSTKAEGRSIVDEPGAG